MQLLSLLGSSTWNSAANSYSAYLLDMHLPYPVAIRPGSAEALRAVGRRIIPREEYQVPDWIRTVICK